MKFTELDLKIELLDAISYMGFDTATQIQEEVIPIILEDRDVIACAQTGTGKTAAFVLPVLNKLIGKNDNSIDTLIIVPTRELAIQIDQQIQGFSYFVSASSIAIYGGGDGKSWTENKDALKRGSDIIVATPGKLLSYLKLGFVDLKGLKHFILDEADKMLDMGFIDDLQQIISFIPKNHQTLMFSATMPKSIRSLAKKILKKPAEVSLSVSKPAEGVKQSAYLCFDAQKIKLIKHVLKENRNYDSIIIFSSTKRKVTDIVHTLRKDGFSAKEISSNLNQDERENVLSLFRSKRLRILVATDVMSRGIDIKEINLVINFEVPHDAEDYVHRVGRTARVNAEGEAITLVNPEEMYKLKKIENLIDISIPKLQPPSELGQGPEWKIAKPKGKRKYYKKKKRK